MFNNRLVFKLFYIFLLVNSSFFVQATNTNVDLLRGTHFKAYAYEVILFFQIYTLNSPLLISNHIFEKKYPPFMTAVKSSDGNITGRKGFCSDFINAFADHYGIRYILKLTLKCQIIF